MMCPDDIGYRRSIVHPINQLNIKPLRLTYVGFNCQPTQAANVNLPVEPLQAINDSTSEAISNTA